MVRRPRSHQLETESRNAFRQILPSQWVCRDIDQDYGFDCEVELFDAATNATGERFLVQLKATDKDEDKPQIRFRSETVAYYEKSVLPVLVVRYGATSKVLHARWFHSLDPNHDKSSASGLTIRFAELDRLTAANVERLAVEVRAYLSLRAASPSTPVHFDLRVARTPLYGVNRLRLYSDICSLAREAPSTLIVSLEALAPQRPLNLINVDVDRIEVKLAGIAGFSLPGSGDFATAQSVLVGLAFSRLGQATRAATLIEIAWPRSQFARHPEICTLVAATLLKARKGQTLIDYARKLIDTRRDEDLATAYMLLTLTYLDFSTSRDINDARAAEMARFAAVMVTKRHRPQAAAMYYSVAVSFRNTRDMPNALRNYRRARVYDPQYGKRAYYCKEVGGVLFLLGRHRLSARFYAAAFEIDMDRTTLPLLADAYMFCGEYRLAQSTLEKYSTASLALRTRCGNSSCWLLR
jgi:tetratricopeptide (TPR) repeat protein